jgi:hypothetical protein
VEDDGVLSRFQDDVEIPAVDRLFGPPPVDHAPLLAHERDRPAVDLPGGPVEVRLDDGRLRLVQAPGGASAYSSLGTNMARVSGIRDQGATSTTVATEPGPVLART